MTELNIHAPMENPETNVSGYYKNWREDLADGLLKLDTLISLQVSTFRDTISFRKAAKSHGFCITEEEVDAILRREPTRQENHSSSAKKSEMKGLLDRANSLQMMQSEKLKRSIELGSKLPLYQLSRFFHLTPFELDAVLICLAPELDLKYEKLYAYLQNDLTKKSPCISLILDILCSTPEQRRNGQASFCGHARLLKYNVIRFDNNTQQGHFLSRGLTTDDRITGFLLGSNSLDPQISSFAKIINPQTDWSAIVMDDALKEKLILLSRERIENRAENDFTFYFCGPHGVGKKLIAEAFCKEMKIPLMVVDTIALLNSEIDFAKAVGFLFRETRLQQTAIYFEHFDQLTTDDPRISRKKNIVIEAMDESTLPAFLSGAKPWDPHAGFKRRTFVEVDVPAPGYQLRKRLWRTFLYGRKPVPSGANISAIANRFRFTGGQIQDAIAGAKSLAMIRGSNSKITMEDLNQSCRAQSNRKLSEMARKIVPHYTWADIVLPLDKSRQLKEISNYVKHRPVVYDDWGFGQKLSLGKGLNVLFSGPSGTGKTMAAEIVANELKLDLYKIDLSCVVSKYIGETEKNLARIFQEAEAGNAILFFDEADALFGKRSEVRDSHDRYANIEINYLLQKMEEHEGTVILASNFRKNIDEAFTRRMHFSVAFPFPEENHRLRIWQNIFPEETPTSDDIDFEFLARNFKISGGNIKNIALNAAFLAAENSRMVNMEHVVWATKREFQKIGKVCVKSDFGKYYNLAVPEGDEI